MTKEGRFISENITTLGEGENLFNGSVRIPTYGFFAMIGSNSGGRGGFLQGTGLSASPNPAGYGIWMNYNTIFDNETLTWRQPRSTLQSLLYSSNHHLNWTWQYPPGLGEGNNNEETEPTEVAKFSVSGNLTLQGSVISQGVNINGYTNINGDTDVNGVLKVSDILKLPPRNQPAIASVGDIYFENTSGQLHVFSGGVWKALKWDL